MKCRTCLQMLDPDCKVSLKKKLSLGKTVEELIQFFIPEMVKSNLVDNSLCPQCAEAVQAFENFIEKCVTVENYLKSEETKQKQKQNTFNDYSQNRYKVTNRSIITVKSGEIRCTEREKLNGGRGNTNNKLIEQINMLLKDSKTHEEKPTEEVMHFMKPRKTYSRKNKALLIPKEEPLDSLDSCTTRVLQTNTSPRSEVFSKDMIKNYIKVSKDHQGTVPHSLTRKPLRSNTCKSYGINLDTDCFNSVLTEYVSEKVQVDVNVAGTSEEDRITTIENEENNSELQSENPITFNKVQQEYLLTSEVNREEYPLSKSKESISTLESNSLPAILDDTTIKTFYPEFYSFPISDSVYLENNRAISVSVPNETMAKFIKDHFQCGINLLKLHSLRETGPKRVLFLGNTITSCPECKQLFSCERILKLHFKQAHFNRKFLMNNSEVASNDKVAALSNELFHDCPVCTERFTSYNILERHLVHQHKEYYLYKCEVCGRKFKRKYQHKQHVKNYEMYQDCSIRKCSICKKIISKYSYKEHSETHRNLECNICKRRFVSSAHFKIHLLNHQKVVKVKQKQIQKALCPICGIDVSCLRTHMITHSENRSHLCDKCSKFFKTRACLVKHIKMVHIDSRLYECSICKVKTKRKCGLRYHMRLKHSDVYSHLCPICGMGFSRIDYYRRHMRQHLISGHKVRMKRKHASTKPTDKTVPCKFCNEKFKGVDKLKLHLLRKHMKNAMRFGCQYCNMTFSYAGNKIRHEKRHENPKAFELTCKVCYNRFSSKENLDAHFVKHKNSKRHICEMCGEPFPSKYLLHHHKGEKHFNRDMAEEEKSILLTEGLSDLTQ